MNRVSLAPFIKKTEFSPNNSHVKKVSIHVPKHKKPLNDDEFGHYLAGLIDGDGSFSSGVLTICLPTLDTSLSYYLKKRLGFGEVKKIKNAVLFYLSNKEGVEKVINLINGKFRLISKLDQIKKHILSQTRYASLHAAITLKLNSSENLNNYWLAGFSDAEASFQIKILYRPKRTEVRLNFQIALKQDYLLVLIKNFIGGYVGHRKPHDTYYYGSTSFDNARKIIKYFDQYHLLSSKHVNYLK